MSGGLKKTIPSLEFVKDPLLRGILEAIRDNLQAISLGAIATTVSKSSVTSRNTPSLVQTTVLSPSFSDALTGGAGGFSQPQATSLPSVPPSLKAKATTSGISKRVLPIEPVSSREGEWAMDASGHPAFGINFGEVV